MHVKLGDGRWLARCLLWGLLVVGALEPYALRAGQWEFIKIADRDTDMPGIDNSGVFSDVSLRGGVVTFRMQGGVAGTLVQYDQGAFRQIIGPNSLFPGRSQPFFTFESTRVNDDLWIAGRTSEGSTGLFRWDDGAFTRLLPASILDPLSRLPFESVGIPVVQSPTTDGRIIFTGYVGFEGQNAGGIYRYSPADGSLETILDRSTLVPGHNVPFNRFSRPVQFGDRVMFAGGNSQDQSAGGLYEWRDGQIVEIAPEAPVLPPPPGYQTRFFPTRNDYGYLGSDPLFTGEDERGGPRTLFLHTGTPTPLASQCADPAMCVEEWRYLYGLSIDTVRNTFATTSGGGVYIQNLSFAEDGRVETVLSGLQLVYDLGPSFGLLPFEDDPSGLIAETVLGPQGLENRAVAFNAYVVTQSPSQSRQVLFLAIRVPEPGTLTLLVSAGVTFLWVVLARFQRRRDAILNPIKVERA